MDTFITLFYIICIIFGILQIILFFKIWAMTDNVKTITYYISQKDNVHLQQQPNKPIPTEVNLKNSSGITIGDLIVHIKTLEQYRVKNITDNQLFECFNTQTPNGILLDRSEIELFDIYYKK